MNPLRFPRLSPRRFACALALLASSSQAAILTNGNMSEGQEKVASWSQMWVGVGKISASRDQAVFRTAPSSLRLSALEGSAKGQISQSAPAVPGERFVASGLIKCEGADTTAQIGLQFFNGRSAPIGFTQIRYVAGDTDWTEGQIEAIAPAGTARVAFVLLLDGNGQAWLDDANLARSELPPAATPPPPVAQSAQSQPEMEIAALSGEGTLIAAIADFRKQSFSYGYEGWKNLSAVTKRAPEGLLLDAPAAGGGGVVYPSPAPIDGATHIRLRYIRHEPHNTWLIHLKLLGTTEVTVTAPLTGPTRGQLESRLVPLPENRPARVNQVQFQGGFSPEENFNITLVDAAFVRLP